jgi:arginyl-tRNA synthetase
MNLFKTLRSAIISAIEADIAPHHPEAELPLHAITVELPREAGHGDLASNAAMVLAKPLRQNPRKVAEMLVEALASLEHLEKVDIAGPGFLNFHFKPTFWQQAVPDILAQGADYGRSTMGGNEPVNIEYVSANPTGPMHIGHARGAVVGDALASLLDFAGYDVTKEYYINDAGAQVDQLARSAHWRYQEALGKDQPPMAEGLYPGAYLEEVGRALAAIYGESFVGKAEDEWLPTIRDFTLEAMMGQIRKDLEVLGVKHDVFTSERALHDSAQVDKSIEALKAKGLIYQGVLEPPKGKTPEDWEPVEQTLFKSTEFGDDVDRPVLRSDGSKTYFAADIGYMQHKLDRGFKRLVMELGADHGGYVKRMKAICAAFSDRQVPLDITLHQMVNLLEDGTPLKMSKRAGRIVSARDLVEEVGVGVLRFIMLTRKSEAVLDFDVKKVLEQSKDNPVFYVQYAHARCHSILRNAKEQAPAALAKLENITAQDLTPLNDEAETSLLRKAAAWPNVVEQAAKSYEPHRVAFYLQELAASLHSLWNAGHENENLRFIVADEKCTLARLGLVSAVATTLAAGLNLLGVEPLEEMR